MIVPTEVSDSESDGEAPNFQIPAFQKFSSLKSGDLSKSTSSTNFHNKSIKLASFLNPGVEYSVNNYVNVDPASESIKEQLKRQKEMMRKELDMHLKNSIVCQPGFEKLESVPTFLSRRQMRKQGLKERDKTKGFQWFNMPAPEMTDEKKNDLLVLQMRQALDPKHFYKRSANKTNSKYFEVGTFVESPIDFYSSRIPKKQRKQTLVDELLADAEFQQYQKKKATEFQKSQLPKYVRRKKEKKTKLLEARSANSDKKRKKKVKK